jgi:alkylmercury lyase
MNIKLNKGTKEEFTSIISGLGMDKVLKVFNYFLAENKSMHISQLAKYMKVNTAEATELAKSRGELNSEEELVGFLGLSVVPTNHKMAIGDKTLYTWCAADTLIFPTILNVEAHIISTDPLNNQTVEVKIKDDILLEITPASAMISWIDEIDQSDIRCSMCNRVHFFSSKESATLWHKNNKDARIFTVTDFFTTDISLNPCC